MLGSEQKLLAQLRTISRVSLLVGLFISLLLNLMFPEQMGWQVAIALLALVVGIPHGAVDHLVTVPKLASLKMVLFLAGYLTVTGLAIWAFLSFNLIAFQVIVLVSALHFGVGDASFVAEQNKRNGKRGFPKIIYALAAGFTPVGIPLVNAQSEQALAEVNPLLVNWAGGVAPQLLVLFVVLSIVALVAMLIRNFKAEALDLFLLLALALLAPPLVAFAVYFGLWHALRHTGRLSLELGASKTRHARGQPWAALWKSFEAGLPALLIVLVFTVVLGLAQGFKFESQILWYLLVVVWALTVPHMALTSRLDARALKG